MKEESAGNLLQAMYRPHSGRPNTTKGATSALAPTLNERVIKSPKLPLHIRSFTSAVENRQLCC